MHVNIHSNFFIVQSVILIPSHQLIIDSNGCRRGPEARGPPTPVKTRQKKMAAIWGCESSEPLSDKFLDQLLTRWVNCQEVRIQGFPKEGA